MPFNYTVVNPDRIVFSRLNSGCGRVLFIFTGSLFAVIGFCLLAFTTDPEMPLSVMRFIVPAFGLLAIYIGIKFPQFQRKSTPDEIIFDNQNGRVEVRQEVSDIKISYIYYDEIKDLVIKTKKVESSKSSARTYYTYHVYLQKKDGGEWELLKRNTQDAALEEISKLKALIRLTATPQKVLASIHQSQKYLISDYGNKSELSWRNKPGSGPVILFCFSIFFLTIFYTIFSTATSFDSDLPVFAYLVGGFILSVFLFVIIGSSLKMIKNAKTVYAVAITSESLDYFERDLGGRVKKNIQFPMRDLHALSFSFDTDVSMRKIFIYTHQQFERKNSLTISLSVESIRENYNFYKNLVALELQDLTAVEALQVENYLQEQIREKAHTNVS